MADKVKGSTKLPTDVIAGVTELNKATKATNQIMYNTNGDIAGMLSADTFEFGREILNRTDNTKSQINSHLAQKRVREGNNNGSSKSSYENVYDIMRDDDLVNSLQTILGTQNIKFKELIKDYEIVKRCIPQVHKVLLSLKNNIVNPDSISKNIVGIKMPASATDSDKSKVNDIIETYKINRLFDKTVMEYLVVSTKYVSVIPYSHITEMLSNGRPMQECIEYLDELSGPVTTLLECSTGGSTTLQESADYWEVDALIPENRIIPDRAALAKADELINTILENIQFVDGGMALFKDVILNEAIAQTDNKEEATMKSIYKRLSAGAKKAAKAESLIASDGLVDDAALEKLRKNVNYRGCHIEELDPVRMKPFMMHGTLIGYFYVDDTIDANTTDIQNAGIMEKINSTIYSKTSGVNRQDEIERMIIKTITNKLISSINPKFLNDNMEDIDVIYEFVKDNQMHTRGKRITFFHPDDIIEFKREDGSIMKNSMFMAKLFILTTLSNTLTNVTRGADRNLYYVKTGLSTDINGHVNRAIRAIKQSQVRYSDIGTINDVFNIIGSTVDVFMPVSPDGEKPIDTEVISGQNVDMNSEFIQYLVRSIILSFGVPSTVVDEMDQVELAKTMAMSNLDMARCVLDGQLELTEPLTKLIRTIVSYEMPEFTQVDEIEAVLNPPMVIVLEMNKDLIDSVKQMSETLSELLIAPESETASDKRKRLFELKYFKLNTPTLDWTAIGEMIREIDIEVAEEILRETALKKTETGSDDSGSSGF
jgi:hypothetical protein